MKRRVNAESEAPRRWWAAERARLREETPPRPIVPAELPELRGTIQSRCGDVISTEEPLWEMSRNFSRRETIRLNVGRLYRPWLLGYERGASQITGIPRRTSTFDDDLVHVAVLYVANEVEKRSGARAEAVLHEFVKFESFLANTPEHQHAERVGSRDLKALQYLGFVRTGKARGVIPRFYRWCVGRGFPGFSAEELLRFRNISLPSHAPGKAIRSRDPVKGALSWEEQHTLSKALHSPTAATEPLDRLITWLFFELGCRTSAIAMLRGRHFKATPLGDGYLVNVPRVKQHAPTEQTVERKISRRLGELAESMVRGREEYLVETVRRGWAAEACRRFAAANRLQTTRLGVPDSTGRVEPVPLPLTPYRLRYTLATSLAEQGASPEQIASMLDDRTLAMAMVYTNNTSELVEILGDTLDNHPAWLHHVGLFLGQVGEERSRRLPVIQGGVPYFTSYADWAERISAIGWCGNPEKCDLRPPLSCYRCAFFLAHPDPAPHLQQLEQLKDEIRSQAGIESDRMAKVLRPDLFAISEVVAITRGGKTNRQRVESRIAGERGATHAD